MPPPYEPQTKSPGEPTVPPQYVHDAPIRYASRSFKVGLVGVILGFVIVSMAYLVWSPPPPQMDLRVATYAPGCTQGSLSQTVSFTANITNMGTVTGVERIHFQMHGSPYDSLPKTSLGWRNYTVVAGGTVQGSVSFLVSDCLQHVYWHDDYATRA